MKYLVKLYVRDSDWTRDCHLAGTHAYIVDAYSTNLAIQIAWRKFAKLLHKHSVDVNAVSKIEAEQINSGEIQ